MSAVHRLSRIVLLTCACSPACDRAPTDPAPADDPAPASGGAPTIADAPPASTSSATAPKLEPDPPSEPDPAAATPSSFATATAPLIAGATPSTAAEASAWTHYRAKRYPEAQREFALASLHEPTNWKPPFNLACASALARDEAMTRVGLTEAIARNPEAAGKKARKDGDLEFYRSAAWFAALLQPEPNTKPEDETELVLTKLPAPDQAAPLPEGTRRAPSKAQLAALRDSLRALHGLQPTIRASLVATTPEGEIAFVVYDYGLYDECRVEDDDELCRDILEAGEPTHDEMANQTTCVEQRIARFEFATAKLGTPEPLAVACVPNEVRRLELVDVDGDGQQEVVVDTIAKTAVRGWTDSPMAYNRARELSIFRLDGSRQFGLSMEADAEMPFVRHLRVFVRDANGDGHLDLIRQSIDKGYDCVDGSLAEDFWPACPADEMPPSATETLLYDPATDTWAT
ncbi:FG-GAP repeat domain-containing protein [Nannocystaceae bacterium ST9]